MNAGSAKFEAITAPGVIVRFDMGADVARMARHVKAMVNEWNILVNLWLENTLDR